MINLYSIKFILTIHSQMYNICFNYTHSNSSHFNINYSFVFSTYFICMFYLVSLLFYVNYLMFYFAYLHRQLNEERFLQYSLQRVLEMQTQTQQQSQNSTSKSNKIDILNFYNNIYIKECPLCYETAPYIQTNCIHSFCEKCFITYIKSRIENEKYYGELVDPCVPCPMCRQKITYIMHNNDKSLLDKIKFYWHK